MSLTEERPTPLYGYLVCCHGVLPDGAPCGNYVVLTPEEKTTCRVCGRVHASWTDYCHSRTKSANTETILIPSPASPSVAKVGGEDSF